MNTWLVLVGSHGSGKSTLGRKVAEALGWPFDPEIGESLRRSVLAADPAAHACRSQAGFDHAVMTRELERDVERMDQGPRVIETWHPGNLAYARNRSPELADVMWDKIIHAVRAHRGRVIVQPLRISLETVACRLREPGPEGPGFVQWLRKVGEDAADIAGSLGLTVLPPLETDRCTINEAASAVISSVRRSPDR